MKLEIGKLAEIKYNKDPDRKYSYVIERLGIIRQFNSYGMVIEFTSVDDFDGYDKRGTYRTVLLQVNYNDIRSIMVKDPDNLCPDDLAWSTCLTCNKLESSEYKEPCKTCLRFIKDHNVHQEHHLLPSEYKRIDDEIEVMFGQELMKTKKDGKVHNRETLYNAMSGEITLSTFNAAMIWLQRDYRKMINIDKDASIVWIWDTEARKKFDEKKRKEKEKRDREYEEMTLGREYYSKYARKTANDFYRFKYKLCEKCNNHFLSRRIPIGKFGWIGRNITRRAEYKKCLADNTWMNGSNVCRECWDKEGYKDIVRPKKKESVGYV